MSYEWRTGESDVENRHNPLWQRTHHASFHDYYGHQSYRNAFLYNESGQIIVESRTAGLHAEWIYMDGLPVATVRWDGHPNGGGDPEVLFIHTDHLGTARYVTDTAGELRAWTLYSTDPFKIRWGGLNFELGFPGQYNMVEVPYWYNWHRDYMPEWGRYLQSDPIGLKGGTNTYLYANANPLTFTDSLGLESRAVSIGIGGSLQYGGAGGSAAILVGQNIDLSGDADDRGRVCVKVVTCARLGPGAALSANVVGEVSDGAFCAGKELTAGGFVEAGLGMFSGASRDSGGAGGSSTVSFKAGVGGGGAIGAQSCITETFCWP